MGEERTPRRLFVGGLFQGITDKDLQDRFARFGDVTGVDVRARKDDVGNVLKTFAYLNMTISDKDYKKCMATFNKTKWRGNEMQIQIAKESFVDRLKREQEEARSKAGQPKDTPTAEPVNLHVKGAVPGTAVEGKPDWVVGKYGVALPVVNLRTKNKKKVIKVDPSKYVHAVKKFEHGKKAEVTTKEADATVNGLTWHMEVEEKDILKKIKGEFPPTATKRKSLTPKKLNELVKSEDSHVTATNDSKVENVYHSNTESCDSDQESNPKKKRVKKAPVSVTKQKNVTLKEEDLQVDCSPAKRKRTISETSTPSAGKDRRNRVVSPDVSIIEAPVNGTPTKSSVSNATAILQQIKLASKKKRKLSSASEEKSKVQPEDLDSSKSKLVKKVTNGKDKKSKPQQSVSSDSSSSEDEQVANTSKTKSPGSKTLKPNKPAKVVQQESSDDSSSSSDSDQQKPPAKKMKPLSKSPAATVVKETKSPVQKAKKAKGKPTPDTSKVIQIEFDEDIGAGSGDEFAAQPKNIQARKAQLRPTPMHQQPRFAQVPSVDEFGVGLLVDDKSAGVTDEERKWNKYNSGGFSSEEDLLDAVSQGRVTKLDRIAKVATQRSQFVETPSLIYPEAGKKPFTPQKVYNSDTDEEDERFQTVQTQPKRLKVKQPQAQNVSLTTGSSSQGDNQLKKKDTNKPNHTSGYAANSESEISIKEKVKQKKLGNKKAIPKKDTDDSSTDEESLPQQSKQKPKRKEMKKNVKGKQLKTADSSPESESDSESESETEVKVPVGKLQIKKSDKSNQRESSDSSKSESGTDTVTKVQKPVTSNLHKSATSSKSKQEESESSDSESSHSDSSDSESEKQVEKSPAAKSPIKKSSISKKEAPDSSDSESSDSESDKIAPKQISKKVQIKKTLSDPKPEETSSSSDSSESETEKAPKQQKIAKVQPNSKTNVSKVTQQKQSSSDSDSSDTDSSSSSSSGVTNKTVPKSPAIAVKLPPSGLKEKNPSKAVAPTPPAKGKVAAAAQSKKSLDANQKRLETLKQRTHEAQAQKNLLKNALASVDSQPSKKIIFDSDDEDVKMQTPSKPTTVTNGVVKRTKPPQSSSDSSDSQSSDDSSDAETKAKEKKAPTLFEDSDDSSSEDEDAEDRFRVRPQFEGKAGSKLISLQSRFANDPRFKITEKFLDEDGEKEDSEDSSDEDEMEEAQEETMDNDSTSAERERAMAILKDVVGGGAVKQGKKNKAVTFKDMSTRHYDPTKDDHKQFELQVETKKKEKKKKQKVVEEEVRPETAPVPEVSGERFFQVETSLKDMFNKDKAVQDQPFSLLAMLGRDNEETTDNTRKVQEDGKGSVLQQVKSPWQQQFGSDDSDDEDRGSEAEASRNFPDVEMAEVKTEIPKVKAVSHGFFFVQNDPRIADGIDFFRRKEDLEVVRRKWAEERPALVEAYRAKRRRFRFMKKDGNTSASPNRAGFGGRGRGRGGGRGRGRGGRR